MTFNPRQQTSIHGRQLALSTTGAIMTRNRDGTQYAALMKSSADVVQDSTALLFSQVGYNPATAISSTISSTLTNFGFVSIASGTATEVTALATLELGTPVDGVTKIIHFDCSGSAITLGGTSTRMVFVSSLSAGAGSSLYITSVPPLAGGVVTLMGFASSEWVIVSASPKLTIATG